MEPLPMELGSATQNEWTHSICSVDVGECCIGCFCRHCAWANLRTTYDGSNCMFNFCCATPCAIRNVIREGYGIEGTCVSDILWECCLPPCTYVQTALEVRTQRRRGGEQYTHAHSIYTPDDDGGNFSYPCYHMDLGSECCYAWLCPQCAAASVRWDFDGSNWLFNLCCVPSAMIYSIVRSGYGIDGSWLGDCAAGCCSCCYVHQLQREVALRGPKTWAKTATQMSTDVRPTRMTMMTASEATNVERAPLVVVQGVPVEGIPIEKKKRVVD